MTFVFHFMFLARRSTYLTLSASSNICYFSRIMDLDEMLAYLKLPQWSFPKIASVVDLILPKSAPSDIIMENITSNEACFKACIEKGREWIDWFDRFFEVFEYPVEWFEEHKVDKAHELYVELNAMKSNQTISLLQMKSTAEKILKILKPLNQLRRLCHLFNCLTSFKIIENDAVDRPYDRQKFISELQASHRDNRFGFGRDGGAGKVILVNGHQNVHWMIASEKNICDVKIEFITYDDQRHLLSVKQNAPIHQKILDGKFETQKAGSLIIDIQTHLRNESETIWYRIKSTNLSKCYLFNGIFDVCYQSYCQQPNQTIDEHRLNDILNEAFSFIDKLLDGTKNMKEMAGLRTTFRNKNIVVEEEIRRLFTNRLDVQKLDDRNTVANPNNNDIQRVCEWLQIYQYFSHINNIIDCIERFDIISQHSDDESVNNLRRLCSSENKDLDITKVHEVLQEQLKSLPSSHLQLIRIVLECSDVIKIMKESDLYSAKGRHRFQELRDNLTTQLQLQERNNMILNSLIVTYVLCEPFVLKAKNFAEFTSRVAQLSNVDENSLKHLKGKMSFEISQHPDSCLKVPLKSLLEFTLTYRFQWNRTNVCKRRDDLRSSLNLSRIS